MPFKWKTDVIDLLKKKGYNTGRIRKEHLISESMLQKIRNGEMVSWATLDAICRLLGCQISDLIDHI